MSTPRVYPCRFEGCTDSTRGSRGYCARHVNVALPCLEEGCKNRCAAYTKRQYCAEHRIIGDRLYRKGFRP